MNELDLEHFDLPCLDCSFSLFSIITKSTLLFQVRKGVIKLPVISANKNKKTMERRRSSGGKSALMKRIEKLNRFEGTTDPRVRTTTDD